MQDGGGCRDGNAGQGKSAVANSIRIRDKRVIRRRIRINGRDRPTTAWDRARRPGIKVLAKDNSAGTWCSRRGWSWTYRWPFRHDKNRIACASDGRVGG